MTLVRELGSEILVQFTVPTRGTWLNTSIHTIPPDAIYDGRNIFVREGKLRTRAALDHFLYPIPITSFDHVIGGIMITAGIKRILLAVTVENLYHIEEGVASWSSTPAVVDFATNFGEVVDTAFLETSSTYVALFAHQSAPLKRWTQGDAAVASVVGTNIPSPKSICIAASRVIALIAPHTVVWSRTLDFTIFDSLAVVKRAQTTDEGICVRNLTALSFVLYKENSIHTARAQAGLSEATAFAFSEPIIAEGPAGVHAVVDVNGVHIYMTKSGRIAIFDGTSYPTWIADGIWFYLQNDIPADSAYRIRGVYDHRLNTVTFFYPRFGQTVPGSLTGMVTINLPFPGFEAQAGLNPYCFLGVCGRHVTHAYTKRFSAEINRALIFTSPSDSVASGVGRLVSHHLSETARSDDGIVFNCSFQTGLQPAPDARHIQVTAETFLERASGNGSVTIEPVYSHSLENTSGTIDALDTQLINLELPVVNEYIGFSKRARFFGLRYTWGSSSTIKYSGAVLYTSSAIRSK